jgi:hypothetical protein
MTKNYARAIRDLESALSIDRSDATKIEQVLQDCRRP